jgi:hypothetical protein
MSQQKSEWILELKDLMSKKVEGIDDEVLKLQKDFKKMLDEIETPKTGGLDDIGLSAKEAGREISNASSEVAELYGALLSGNAAGAASAISGLASNFGNLTKAAWAFIATPIGAAIAALAAIGLATKEWVEFNQEAKEANILVKAITNDQDSALSGLRVRAMALQDTFGGDWQDHLRQVTSLQKGFGISSQEAFDVYTRGMVEGGRANDEFKSSINEYPKLFEKYGFSAQEFVNVINDSQAAGVWSDKLPDALKEFGLSIEEQTQGSRDALENAFGKKFTDGLFKNVREGSITVREALKMVGAEADKTSLNQQQQAQLTADLFRGAGEDAGGFATVMGIFGSATSEAERELSRLEQKLSDVADRNERLRIAQKEALESETYKVFAEEVSAVWDEIKIWWYNLLTGFQDGILTISDSARDLLAGFKGMFSEAISSIFSDFIALKNEIGDVINAFMEAGNVWDAFKNDGFSAGVEAAKAWAKNIKDEVADVGDVEADRAGRMGDAFMQGVVDQQLSKEANKLLFIEEYDAQNKAEEEGKKGKSLLGGDGSNTTPLGIGGNGGGGRVINMTLDIKNYFNTGDSKRADVTRMADEIIGVVVDRLRDSAISIA